MSSALKYKLSTWTIWLWLSAAATAYEAGTCFIFDVLPADRTEPVAHRIPIDRQALAANEKTEPSPVMETSKKSEFDFTQTQGTQSGFGSNEPKASFDFNSTTTEGSEGGSLFQIETDTISGF